MNEHAQKWVEALRSGEFEQTTSALRNDSGFCCLGVACEVYRRETGDGEWVRSNESWVPFAVDGHQVAGELPSVVIAWLGLETATGVMASLRSSLAHENDGGATFERIATIIESEPDGLFQEEAGSHDDA